METANKKERKTTFICIVVLLVLFIPITSFSIYLKATGKDKPKPKENLAKEFFFENKLWFYDDTGSLLGTYECENPTGLCDYAGSKYLEDNYSLRTHPYKDMVKIKTIQNRYAFLVDSAAQKQDQIFLYDIVNHLSYKASPYLVVKNYDIGIENELFIIQNTENLYGVMQLKETPKMIIPFEYNLIFLQDQVNEDGKLKADSFVVYRDGRWMIINQENEPISTTFINEIVAYTSDTIITKDSIGQFHFVNYQDEKIFEDDGFIHMTYTEGNYLNVYKTTEYFVYDIEQKRKITNPYPITAEEEYTSRINENGSLEILLNQEVIDVIDFS